MFETGFLARKTTPQGAVSVAEIAHQEDLTYAEATHQALTRGQIAKSDIRAHLNPARVREFRKYSSEHIQTRIESTLRSRVAAATSREDRVYYAAMIKSHRKNAGALTTDPHRVARGTERAVLAMAHRNPSDPALPELVAMTAALSDKAQARKISRGFMETNNISHAARIQQRPWREVRDDLVKFGLLDRNDPRRKIRPSDIKKQARGGTKRSKTLSPEAVEAAAMTRLKKNPRDEMGLAWLAAAGALQDTRKTKRVQGYMPRKHPLFGAQRARSSDLVL